MFLVSLLIAQKERDDLAYQNAYFIHMYQFLKLHEINRMEKLYLQIIKYDIIVSRQMYVEYYFELRSLAANSPIEYPISMLKPRKDIRKLDIFSQGIDDVEVQSRLNKSI